MRVPLTLPALVVVRLLLALSPLPALLKWDHQLSSPLTSFVKLQEGVHLYKNGIDPYQGGSFYHSPIYLSLFSTILPTSPLPSLVLWTAVDALAAYALLCIWRARVGEKGRSREGLVVAAYLLNPYLFLSNLALSTASIENMLMLWVLAFASSHNPSPSLLTLSLLTTLSLPSILLLPPLIMLLLSSPLSKLKNPVWKDIRRALPLLAEFIVYEVALCLVCTLGSGGWQWVGRCWGVGLTLPDLTPNPGLWWYFFTEMFDHFRPFFLMVFSVHLVIYVIPICLKFQHDPLYASFLLLGILGIFKPYPTLADPGLFLSFGVVFCEVWAYLRHPFPTFLLHLHSSLLLPLFHHLWLGDGTGNANFFYASTLVFGLAGAGGLIDAVWAGLRCGVGDVNGKVREGMGVGREGREMGEVGGGREGEMEVDWEVIQE
ncbi:hypothetical protein JAAARDRAFT_133454 [Jaapia argillacea MUCL 33604]|uniref:PIG-U-domain-containing protein n=1 Tax=Jaapia argillacea MUCL 33604 TaxID=933084 RepID=A0A067PPN1_9AGAM|nr:hypothetical protein JAAARDRAFT_133454 [Jaapia argillacea MUCL 33604]